MHPDAEAQPQSENYYSTYLQKMKAVGVGYSADPIRTQLRRILQIKTGTVYKSESMETKAAPKSNRTMPASGIVYDYLYVFAV